jgi:hypothetical protein
VNYYFPALLLVCCLYAFVAGGTPERLGAAAYGLACLASHLVVSAPAVQFRGVEKGVFVVDVLVFAAFAILALHANRYWPIWVSALLGVSVLAHPARWAGPDTVPWAYQFVMSIWSYPILAIIAIGTLNHRRRLASSGADPSWSSSSGSSARPAPPGGPL